MATAVILPIFVLIFYIGWSEDLWGIRPWIFIVLLQGIGAVGAFVATETGEIDEEKVEKIVDEQFIHAHEEAAEVFLYAFFALFLVGLVVFLVKNSAWRKRLILTSFLGAVTVAWLGIRTGDRGGALVYDHGAAEAHKAKTNSMDSEPVSPEDEEVD